MAKIFLDANAFIDLMTPRNELQLEQFSGRDLFISPLSIHIFLYVYKQKIPLQKLNDLLNHMELIPITTELISLALQGPMDDFEDNIHLHSAVEADCDFFLTSDQKLLKMGIFGKTRIVLSMQDKDLTSKIP